MAIVFYSEILDSAGELNPDNLDEIYRILEDSKDSRFHILEINKYRKVTYFVKFLMVIDPELIPT